MFDVVVYICLINVSFIVVCLIHLSFSSHLNSFCLFLVLHPPSYALVHLAYTSIILAY